MEEFQKIRNTNIRRQRNIAVLGILIYISAILVLFGFGGNIAKLATGQVPLISEDGIVKITAIICFLMLVAIIFVPGPVILISETSYYFHIKD